MSDEVRRRLKRIGWLQKDIILKLAEEVGVTSPASLRRRWPSSEKVPAASDIAASAMSIFTQPRTAATQYAPYLSDDYFESPGNETVPEGEDWVSWSPREFLGRPPTQSESVALSKSVRKLEARGLIETARTSGKGKQVSHVKLTFYGEVAAVLLLKQEAR